MINVFCKKYIHHKMWLTVLLVASLGLFLVLAACWQGSSIRFASACCVIELLALASLIDIETRTIPHTLVGAMLAICLASIVLDGVAAGAPPGTICAHVIAAYAQGLAVAIPLGLLASLLERITGSVAFGGGDVKLMFTVGCYLGWYGALVALALACISGLALAAFAGQRTFPFAPSIALGCILVIIASA